MKPRVVVCGGTGLIGRALCEHLKNSGYEVTVVSRKPSGEEVGWDSLVSVLEGSTVVINLSGRPIACKFTETNKKEVLESRVESTRLVAAAISQCANGPVKWINASAVGYYGSRGDDIMDESSEPGTGFVADVCRAWEDACLRSSTATPKVVLRIGVVFSLRGGALAKLITLTKFFLGGSVGDGRQWMSWIVLSDLVQLIQWSIEHDMPSVVNACTPNPIRNRDLMAWLRRELRRPWSPPVPTFMLEIMGKTVGPDASLLLDSCRAVPKQTGGFRFDFPDIESLSVTDAGTLARG